MLGAQQRREPGALATGVWRFHFRALAGIFGHCRFRLAGAVLTYPARESSGR